MNTNELINENDQCLHSYNELGYNPFSIGIKMTKILIMKFIEFLSIIKKIMKSELNKFAAITGTGEPVTLCNKCNSNSFILNHAMYPKCSNCGNDLSHIINVTSE